MVAGTEGPGPRWARSVGEVTVERGPHQQWGLSGDEMSCEKHYRPVTRFGNRSLEMLGEGEIVLHWAQSVSSRKGRTHRGKPSTSKGYSSVVERALSMRKVLGSVPSSTTKQQQKHP